MQFVKDFSNSVFTLTTYYLEHDKFVENISYYLNAMHATYAHL